MSKRPFSSSAAVGYRAEGPGYLVWYETPEEAESWATALAGARRVAPTHRESEQGGATGPHDPSHIRRPRRTGLPRVLLCGPALSGAEDVGAQGPASVTWDHQHLQHRYVRITDAGPHPRSQTLGPEHAVGWLNDSSMVARVSFPARVATHMTCTSEGDFRLVGERLVSPDIQASQLASLCRLEPGTYPYAVTLAPGIGSAHRPLMSFEGHLLVQARR